MALTLYGVMAGLDPDIHGFDLFRLTRGHAVVVHVVLLAFRKTTDFISQCKGLRLTIYPGVYHAHESTAWLAEEIVERGRRCSVLRKEDGALVDRDNREQDSMTPATAPG